MDVRKPDKRTQHARRLRRDVTDAERALWQHLRALKVEGTTSAVRQQSAPTLRILPVTSAGLLSNSMVASTTCRKVLLPTPSGQRF